MEIYKHPVCDDFIGAPSDIQDGTCDALPVVYHTDEYGTWTNSFWKPDAAEIAALVDGGSVRLQVRASGRQHPVVAMQVVFKPQES